MADRRKPQIFEDYDAAEQHWLSVEKTSLKGTDRALGYLVSAAAFIDQLEILHSESGDQRFQDAVTALYDNGFMKGENWRQTTPYYDMINAEAQYKADVVECIDGLINDLGISHRLAYANCAANLRWHANSFEAAVKALERLHRAHSKSQVEDIS
ncbi:hypothetical protein [Methylobacterium brachythecii]|uniref:Uncharacterized protein n=1 Tax=Methylobacterium brachythecii TaxID=1176177 RepID=A0A7W6AT75_9HYPH|nr:hypothetical protein [Methylobacterium brachythecii]MBB3905537.1 hypothetical protein [Methylobacterium brachythecii]GLS46266.1 hypothetical protein GCM10007884_42580 [Methylobacterium brachythecii]